MGLNAIWFFLFVLIITGYLILDGFDLGVGILHPFAARTDEERRLSLNSIGPIWDGNEVWLITGGGVLFAAFPIVYASLLSGFYEAMMLILLVLILRTVAIEFRSKREGASWRRGWDITFFISSGLLAALLGLAFGNIVLGVPLNQQGIITEGSILDMLHPFALLVGATTVAMFALHGAVYLSLKTEGALQSRARHFAPWLMGIFVVTGLLTVLVAVLSRHQVLTIYSNIWPLVFPLGAAAALLGVSFGLRRGRDLRALVCSGAMIALLMLSVAAGLYPNLLISTIDPQYSLTAFNAASQDNTLMVMLVVAAIGIPFVLLYTAGVYYIFRGKVRLSPDSY